MNPRASVFTFAAAALLVACGGEPKLDVQRQSQSAGPAAPDAAARPQEGGPPIEAQPAHPAGAPAAGELPAGHPPLTSGEAAGGVLVPAVTPGAGQGAAALAWQAPGGWTSEPPSNSMRRAQYRVPGAGGEGECVVFYFGPGQGGSPMANAERWAGQFADEKGQPATATMKTRSEKVAGTEVLFVEAAGTYLSGGMMGDAVVPKHGWALLGAVVEGPDANWFFKLTGPQATVEAQRAAFEAMVRSIRHGA